MNIISAYLERRRTKQFFGGTYPLFRRLQGMSAPVDGLTPEGLRALERRWREAGVRSKRGFEHVLAWCVNKAGATNKSLEETTADFEALMSMSEASAAELRRLGGGFF